MEKKNSRYHFKPQKHSSHHGWNYEVLFTYSGGQQNNCRRRNYKKYILCIFTDGNGIDFFSCDASGVGLKWHPLVFYTVSEPHHGEFTPHLQTLLILGHSQPPGKGRQWQTPSTSHIQLNKQTACKKLQSCKPGSEPPRSRKTNKYPHEILDQGSMFR